MEFGISATTDNGYSTMGRQIISFMVPYHHTTN